MHASDAELFIGAGIVVVANAAATLWVARRAVTIESALGLFGARLAFNVAFVLVTDWLLGGGGLSGGLEPGDAFLFLMLISLITTLHDRFLPVLETRKAATSAAVASP